jgi:hypothetical protein
MKPGVINAWKTPGFFAFFEDRLSQRSSKSDDHGRL